jgi:hypothetical protein
MNFISKENIKNGFIRFRHILETNKIFFETFASGSLIFIAVKANQISANQIRAEKMSKQPQFVVKYEKGNGNDNLSIEHHGGSYEKLICRIGYLAIFTFPDTVSKGISLQPVSIADNNSSFPIFPIISPNKKNEIPSFDSLVAEVQKRFGRYCDSLYSIDNSSLFLRTYLMLEYQDFEKEKQVRYYDLSYGTGYLLNDNEKEWMFDFDSYRIFSLEQMGTDAFYKITHHEIN